MVDGTPNMVDGTIDSSSFRGAIKIDGYRADRQILPKRVANLSGCNHEVRLSPPTPEKSDLRKMPFRQFQLAGISFSGS
jgi:hypothetical protein